MRVILITLFLPFAFICFSQNKETQLTTVAEKIATNTVKNTEINSKSKDQYKPHISSQSDLRLHSRKLALDKKAQLLINRSNEPEATNVAESDSLALVNLYNATGGSNWTNNTNWLVPGQPVSTWVGVFTAGDRVTALSLGGNNMNGQIPAEIGNLTALQALLLNGNSLSGEIPPELGSLQDLTWIDLRSNAITGNFPSFFLNTIADGFYASSGLYKGPGLELFLEGNQLSGSIPAFPEGTYLVQLDLGENQLTGVIPTSVGNLDSLNYLNLGANQLEGAVPSEIGALANLTFLGLYQNNFTGFIPSSIGNLLNLNYLGLFENLLSGPIPTSLGNLSSVQTMYLGDNDFSGSLPVELGSIAGMQRFDVRNCQLTGNIPTSFGNWTSLVEFGIANNQLEGAIPAGFSNMAGITFFWIANNNLTDLPDLSALTLTTTAGLEGNRFDFDDLEPNVGIPSVSYIPQQSLSTDTLIFDLATPLSLEFAVGGSANEYQWLLNGDTLFGETTPSITVPAGSTDDYQLQITSSLVPDLTITSGLYRFLSEPVFNQNPEFQFSTYQIKTNEESFFVGSSAADVNDDGIDDLAVAFRSTLYIYLGGRLIDSEPDIIYSPTVGEIQNMISGKGDNDAIDDIILSVADQTDGVINFSIAIPGSQGLSQETLNPIVRNFDEALPLFGLTSFASTNNFRRLGDINNDGFDDLGVSTANGSNILVYLGGTGFAEVVPIAVPQPEFGFFSSQIFELNDINGDNIDDFLVGAVNSNSIFLYFGSESPDLSSPSLSLKMDTSAFFRNQNFFAFNALGVDVNGDSFNDIVFRPAIPRDNQFPDVGLNSIFVLYGGPDIDSIVDDAFSTPAYYREGENTASTWAVNDFQLIGDYDGDGIDDIYMGPDQGILNNPNATIFSTQNLSSGNIPGIVLVAPNQEISTFGGNDNNIYQNTDMASGDFNDNGLIEMVAGQPSENGYNLFIYENFQAPGDLFYDSLVLAGIYQDTDGDNWTNNTNWLEGAVDTWEGVTITTSRVRSINLANNGLKGELVTSFDKLQDLESIDLSNNQISGQLNESLLVLPQLTSLNVANNEFTRIPDFNNASSELLSTIDVSGNRLDFGDLEPVFEITGLNYANQKNLKLEQDDTVFLAVGRDTTVSVAADGSLLSYQWRYQDTNITNASDSTFIIENIGRSNMGDYTVQITSGIVPNLTLISDPAKVLATAVVSVNILDTSGELIPDPISASLMETVRRTRGYDTLSVQQEVASSFAFEPVILLDYLVGVSSDPELYVDTYYQNVFEWQEADILVLESDTTINISITTIPQPGDGEGVVRGTIEEDFTEEEGRIEARRRAKGRKCGLKRRVRGGRPGQTGDFVLFAYGETNDNGEFEFGFLPEGTYRFFVEYPGIPLDESSFVEFEIGEAGVSDDDFTLAATVTENGIVVELILGLTSQFFTDFNVYPNPTTDQISVSYDKILSENLVMQLIDMNGNTLESRKVQKGRNGKLEMSLSKYQEGMYFLKFYDEKSGNIALTLRILKR